MPRSKPAEAAADELELRRPSRLQMADIARLANVSISTVSRALNDNPRLSEKTRTRIKELAKSLNYSVDAGARMLRGKELQTVAVAFPYHPTDREHFKDPLFMALIGSIGDALIDSGYSMLIVPVEAEQFEMVIKPYESRQAIGTILLGQERYHQRINQMAARGVPMVVWGARMTDQLYCSVGSDNILGGIQATEHLLSGGARRIAFLGNRDLPEIGHRYQGYLSAHQARGIDPDPQLYLPVPFSENEARHEIDRLLRETPGFDALFACSDLLALTMLSALKARGRRVPEDVKVVGYDDIYLAAIASPPLTSVRQELGTAGKALVDLLFAKLRGQPVQPLILPTELVIRESSRVATARR